MYTLLDIWMENKKFFELKNVKQIISICGSGELKDNNTTSQEFRELLKNISSDYLIKYADDCLSESFPNSGFILQDNMNQIGARLGYKVDYGLYRGTRKKDSIGFDGIWTAKNGHQIVVEVKTTDAYRINLDTLADYRNRLIEDNKISKRSSSILIIVGRQDTGDLEAQIRGSRHAWDMRLISADAILKLMLLKENLNDTKTAQQINEILKPLEYTKVDSLIDIIFNTTEDLQLEDLPPEDTDDLDIVEAPGSKQDKVRSVKVIKPAQFNDLCVEKTSKFLNIGLVKVGRCLYVGANEECHLVCLASKEYPKKNRIEYWYAFRTSHREFLLENKNAYIALGCGSANKVLLLPYMEFDKDLEFLRTSTINDRLHWHVDIVEKNNNFYFKRGRMDELDVTKYFI